MKFKRIRVLAEACQVVRPVCLSVVAIAVVAAVMAFQGWHTITVVLGGVLALIAGLMIFQVHRAVSHLHQESHVTREVANQAEQHYIQVLLQITQFVEARDKYIQGHSERVACLSEQIARAMDLPDHICAGLKVVARLHDLGMLAVPDKILNQRKRLAVDSFSAVRAHPDVGYEILKPLQSLEEVLPALRYHHERMNGTGYPAGLAGEEIPIEARILAVADAYDAMTHDRPHRPAMTAISAMEELQRCSPAGYDRQCVEVLAKLKNLWELSELSAAA